MSAPAAPPAIRSQSPAGLASDLAGRLRTAAAAGRTAEVAALLDQGAAVDAADAEGDTALMKSIRGNHPAVAAVLRRHGASLDRRNRAGKSARDLAAAKGDAELNQAIGLGP
jgi:ankyrin repeat protein